MTRLLVSVRNPAEAQMALAAGTDLIDIKEPRAGALGAAKAETIAAIVEFVAGRAPISAALGELVDVDGTNWKSALRRVQFAKIGLAGCARSTDWRERWATAMGDLPRGVAAVAVVYADGNSSCPPQDAILEQATRLGCAAVLVDTWDKSAGPLTAHRTTEQIRSFVLEVSQRGMLAVVGGGLTAELIKQILPARPDFVAVRGAVCRCGRSSDIEEARVRRLKHLIARRKSAGSDPFA